MVKIILTDLDGTLVNKNTELEFMIYFLKDRSFRFRKFINFGYWIISKLQSHIFLSKNNFKFLYYKIDANYLDQIVEKWLSTFEISSLKINKKILQSKEETDIIFILTNCPSFISLPFCKRFLPFKINGIFSTEIYVLKNSYHFKVKRKMVGNNKQVIAKELIKRYGYQSFGYGDSQSDLPFISACDEQFTGGFFS